MARTNPPDGQLLFICYVGATEKRPFPDAPWIAGVRWGPTVWAKTRRAAIRRAIHAYLQERSQDPVTNLTVTIARKKGQFEIRQLEYPESFTHVNRMKG